MRRLELYFVLVLWMTFGVSAIGQEISLLQLKGYMPGTFLNPGLPLDKRVNISVGAIGFRGGTNGPSIGDITSKNLDGKRYIDLDKFSGSLNPNQDIFGQSEIRTLDLAIKLGSFALMAGHGMKAFGNLTYTSDLIHLAAYGNGNYIGKTLDLGPVLDVSAYNELYIGVQKTSGRFTLGLKAKLLYGISNIYTESSDIKLTTLEEYYQLQFKNDYIVRSSGLLRYHSLDSITIDNSLWSFDNLFYNNRGFAIDLGASFKVNENLTISASALDLGSISWDFFPRRYSSQGTFTFEGVDVVDYITDSTLSISDTLLNIIDVRSDIEEYSTTLNYTFTIGGHYQSGPWSFNALYMLHNKFGYRDHAMSLSAIRKIAFFDLGLQYRISKNDYSGLGLYSRLNLGPVALYLASDNLLGLFNIDNAKSASIRFGTTLQF